MHLNEVTFLPSTLHSSFFYGPEEEQKGMWYYQSSHSVPVGTSNAASRSSFLLIAKGLLISVLNPARSEIRPSPAYPLPLKTDFDLTTGVKELIAHIAHGEGKKHIFSMASTRLPIR